MHQAVTFCLDAWYAFASRESMTAITRRGDRHHRARHETKEQRAPSLLPFAVLSPSLQTSAFVQGLALRRCHAEA